MIRITIPLFLLLTSCASVNYSYFSDLKNVISKNKLNVDESFIQDQPYSFIKISNSKNDAIFVLANITESGIYEWVGQNYERIKTKDGLIIETFGLESDIKFHHHNFSILDDASKIDSYINLYNPDLYYEAISLKKEASVTSINDMNEEIKVIKFVKSVPGIGWTAKESFTFKNNIIFKTKQSINPHMDHLVITFYFKY